MFEQVQLQIGSQVTKIELDLGRVRLESIRNRALIREIECSMQGESSAVIKKILEDKVKTLKERVSNMDLYDMKSTDLLQEFLLASNYLDEAGRILKNNEIKEL